MNIGNGDGKVRDLLAAAQKQGFRLEHDRKSFKLYPPNKSFNMIVISSTPSDRNYFWELRRQLKRAGYQEVA